MGSGVIVHGLRSCIWAQESLDTGSGVAAHGLRSHCTRAQESLYTGSGVTAHGLRSRCARAQESLRTGSGVIAHGLSSCDSQAPGHRLSGCGTWTLLLCGVWDLPGSGIKLVFPTFRGRFLTMGPPEKPILHFNSHSIFILLLKDRYLLQINIVHVLPYTRML